MARGYCVESVLVMELIKTKLMLKIMIEYQSDGVSDCVILIKELQCLDFGGRGCFELCITAVNKI